MGNINRRELIHGLAFGALLPAGGLHATADVDSISQPGHASRSLDAHREEVQPGIWKMSFGSSERFTPVSLRRFPPSTAALGKLPEVKETPTSISAELSHRGCVLEIPLDAGERVYGFGLQLHSHQQRKKKRVLRVNADPPGDTGDTHAPVPFFVTTKGYGVFIDTARYATFYIDSAHDSKDLTGDIADAADNPIAARSSILVEIHNVAGADAYIFAGPSMREAVQRYNLFSGGGCLPPDWGLGFWYRAGGDSTQKQVLELAREFRERKIPCDVIGLEPGWQTHAYSCSYVWSSRFPDPTSMLRSLGAKSFRVNLWEHAFTHPASPIYEPLKSHSGDYAVFGGLVPDFVDPEARRIFSVFHKQQLVDRGISGFKLDECDNSDFVGGWSFPELSRFPSGIDGEQMHSVFGLRYQDSVLDAFVAAGKSTYSLVRSSGALASPYPFVLYSDLYNHRDFVRALVNSGFCGLLWSPEVRDAESSEDLIRRLQTVIFSPLAMINAWYIANPPWKQQNKDKNNRNEFAPDWEAMESRCREIIGWRMQLLPYLKAAFERYNRDGLPPFRALAMDYPDDPGVADVDDEYLVGDRMIVAPVFAGQTQRRIVLPKGRWCDFWTGKAVEGNSIFSVETSLDRIPVYVKWGAVFPTADVGLSTQDPVTRQIVVRIYGDGSLPFVLGDDSSPTRLSLRYNSSSESQRPDSSWVQGYFIQRWQQMQS